MSTLSAPRSVCVVAGEASGDLLAAGVVRALQQRDPSLKIFGMAGVAMSEAGVEPVARSEELSVMGLIEVLKQLPRLLRLLKRLRMALRQRRPDLVILIDVPDFNLKLAKTATKLGLPVLYYVSPQVWAWRKKRVHKIARVVSHMAVLFPFEVEVYRQACVPVTHVGHPLARTLHRQHVPAVARAELGLEPTRQTIGLFPGSRRSEVERLLPVMLQAARKLAMDESVQFVLSQAQSLEDELFSVATVADLPLKIVRGQSARAAEACDAVIAASGTLTLELALLEVPMVIVYRAAPLTWAIFSRLVKIPHVSLVNILLQHGAVPELLQDRANPDAILAALRPLLQAEGAAVQQRELARIRGLLGEGDASAKVAELAEQLMQQATA
jgi:lipid-A-disaccharide synthase